MNSFIQKIHKNFEKSIQDYDKVSKSKYWSQSINKKKKLFNKKSLKDFRSNNLSKNIDDFYIDKTKTKKLYKNLEKECGKKFIKNFLLVNNIGNAKKILKIDNKIITPSDLFHIKYLHDLKKKNKS